MELGRAELLGNQLMGEWGLLEKGWRFQFDRAKRRFGCCRTFRKMVTLSRYLTELNGESQMGRSCSRPRNSSFVPNANWDDSS